MVMMMVAAAAAVLCMLCIPFIPTSSHNAQHAFRPIISLRLNERPIHQFRWNVRSTDQPRYNGKKRKKNKQMGKRTKSVVLACMYHSICHGILCKRNATMFLF